MFVLSYAVVFPRPLRSRKSRFQKNSRPLRNADMSLMRAGRIETLALPALLLDLCGAKTNIKKINMESGIKQLQSGLFHLRSTRVRVAKPVRLSDICATNGIC
jgi:hypothetical protein